MQDTRKDVEIAYDKKADVLYVSFGKLVKAAAEEVKKGVFARYSPKTKKLVGFTITNFSKKFKAKPRHIGIPEKT